MLLEDNRTDGCKRWLGPVVIRGVEYRFAPVESLDDHTRLWSVGVALAAHAGGLELIGTTADLGCGGNGLVGMVTGATLIEVDAASCELLRANMELNQKPGRVLNTSWENVTERFDNVLGSEILYPAYKPASVAEFVARCWTGKGICLFAISQPKFAGGFEDRLTELGIAYVRDTKLFGGFAYTLWTIGGPHAA